jgi:hypothetical protein
MAAHNCQHTLSFTSNNCKTNNRQDNGIVNKGISICKCMIMQLCRGAVSLLCMGMWGPERHQVLATIYSPSAILPHINSALVACSFHINLLHDVLLVLNRLVLHFGYDLHTITWRICIFMLSECAGALMRVDGMAECQRQSLL